MAHSAAPRTVRHLCPGSIFKPMVVRPVRVVFVARGATIIAYSLILFARSRETVAEKLIFLTNRAQITFHKVAVAVY
jgi:hypothetical protein